jgi:hypothetical protein
MVGNDRGLIIRLISDQNCLPSLLAEPANTFVKYIIIEPYESIWTDR